MGNETTISKLGRATYVMTSPTPSAGTNVCTAKEGKQSLTLKIQKCGDYNHIIC